MPRARHPDAGLIAPDGTRIDLLEAKREAAPLINGLLEPVRSLLKRSADFDEFGDGLLKLYPKMDSTAIAELMGQAFAVVTAASRFSIVQEGEMS